MLTALIVAVLAYALDQLTKYAVESTMQLGDSVAVIPGVLRWHYILNPGAAFSIGEDHTWVFTVIQAVVAVAAVVVMSAAMGQVPWIALGLATSFGLYGFVKKRFPSPVHAVTAMTAETVVLIPVFVVGSVLLAQAGLLTTVTEGPGHFWLMAGLGVLTAVPLILFSAAARSLTLTTLGMLQYTAPILQFLVAVTVLGEQMPAARWAGFGLIWLSLAVFTLDQLNASRLQRRAVRAGQGAHA